jgi:hypothetical protein
LQCYSASIKNVIDQVNNALVQNMELLDEQAIHIQSKYMQYRAESNSLQKMQNTKGQCLQVNLSIHKFFHTGFVVS